MRFIIGLQLRSIFSFTHFEQLSEKNKLLIIEYRERWKKFLRNIESGTGNCETHIFFFAPTEGSEGDISKLASNINVYLIRAMDNTILDSESGKILAVFSKIGPIGFITTIKPSKLTGLTNTKINMKKNRITCAQKYMNPTIVNFLWKGRPEQVLAGTQTMSFKQKQKINNSYLKNPARVINSLGHRMIILDSNNK